MLPEEEGTLRGARITKSPLSCNVREEMQFARDDEASEQKKANDAEMSEHCTELGFCLEMFYPL
jgi:hypothetical protein